MSAVSSGLLRWYAPLYTAYTSGHGSLPVCVTVKVRVCTYRKQTSRKFLWTKRYEPTNLKLWVSGPAPPPEGVFDHMSSRLYSSLLGGSLDYLRTDASVCRLIEVPCAKAGDMLTTL